MPLGAIRQSRPRYLYPNIILFITIFNYYTPINLGYGVLSSSQNKREFFSKCDNLTLKNIVSTPLFDTNNGVETTTKLWCTIEPSIIRGKEDEIYTATLHIFSNKKTRIYWVAAQNVYTGNPTYVTVTGDKNNEYANYTVALQVRMPSIMISVLVTIKIYESFNPLFTNNTYLSVSISSGESFGFAITPNSWELQPNSYGIFRGYIISNRDQTFYLNVSNSISFLHVSAPTTMGTGKELAFLMRIKADDQAVIGSYQIELIAYTNSTYYNSKIVKITILGPTFSLISASSQYPLWIGPVRLSTVIADDGSGIRYVKVHYSTDGSVSWKTLDLELVDYNTYETLIPSYMIGTNISYYVEVAANSRRTVLSEVRGYTIGMTKSLMNSIAVTFSLLVLVIMIGIVLKERNIPPPPDITTAPPPPGPPSPPSNIPPPPPLVTIRIKTLEQEEPAPELPIPPPVPLLLESSEQFRYKSQFYCKACQNSFLIDEHKFKVNFCQKCGAPNPVFVAKAIKSQ